MENNTFKLNKGYFSFRDLIGKAFGVVGHIADKKQVALVMEDIPQHEAPYYERVYGDESRFLQVCLNFLSNSLKFSDPDSKIVVFLKMIENQTATKGPG